MGNIKSEKLDNKAKPGKNKGEISEFYVFLTSLRDGKIFAADDNLNIVEDLCYSVNTVVTQCRNGITRNYVISKEDGSVQIEEGTVPIDFIDHETISEDADTILEGLKKPTEGGVLDLDATPLMAKYHLDQINANSRTKADIVLEICDPYSGTVQRLPFSIKSFMGGNPTLLNSSGSTNLTYRIEGDLSDEDIRCINSMVTKDGRKAVDIKNRIEYMYEKGCKLVFEKIDNETFEGNLRVIDSLLPEIVAEMLLVRYRYNKKYIAENTDYISKQNPMHYRGPHEFYRAKVRNLLMASFTGMMPGTVWNGTDAVHGGYIVVRRDGSIVCYHLYNRDKFESYLFNRTYLETGSATRHRYAVVERDENGLYFKLNLAIRMDNGSNQTRDSPAESKTRTKIEDYRTFE